MLRTPRRIGIRAAAAMMTLLTLLVMVMVICPPAGLCRILLICKAITRCRRWSWSWGVVCMFLHHVCLIARSVWRTGALQAASRQRGRAMRTTSAAALALPEQHLRYNAHAGVPPRATIITDGLLHSTATATATATGSAVETAGEQAGTYTTIISIVAAALRFIGDAIRRMHAVRAI